MVSIFYSFQVDNSSILNDISCCFSSCMEYAVMFFVFLCFSFRRTILLAYYNLFLFALFSSRLTLCRLSRRPVKNNWRPWKVRFTAGGRESCEEIAANYFLNTAQLVKNNRHIIPNWLQTTEELRYLMFSKKWMKIKSSSKVFSQSCVSQPIREHFRFWALANLPTVNDKPE